MAKKSFSFKMRHKENSNRNYNENENEKKKKKKKKVSLPSSSALYYLSVLLYSISFMVRGSSGQDIARFVQASSSMSSLIQGEEPRLIPLVAAESGYSENASVNILCTIHSGHHESLSFDWFKDNQLISSNSLEDSSEQQQQQQQQESNLINSRLNRIHIEKSSDHSLLRISRVQLKHAGRYTCSAKNQFGQDSSSVQLRVNGKWIFSNLLNESMNECEERNILTFVCSSQIIIMMMILVKMHWTKEPPQEVFVSANQDIKIECSAQGEPRPSIRWEKLSSTTNNNNKPSSSLALSGSRSVYKMNGQHQSTTSQVKLSKQATSFVSSNPSDLLGSGKLS